jgi:hypothetical protein
LGNRPNVLAIFYKYAHDYERDYSLEANTLGGEIMGWWEDVKSTNVRVGGPTGMYNFVVLMSWWCSLLKGRPSGELSDCLHTLEDIDRTILSALHGTTGQPCTMPAPGGSSSNTATIVPTPQPRGTKRATPKEPSSRKQTTTKGSSSKKQTTTKGSSSRKRTAPEEPPSRKRLRSG